MLLLKFIWKFLHFNIRDFKAFIWSGRFLGEPEKLWMWRDTKEHRFWFRRFVVLIRNHVSCFFISAHLLSESLSFLAFPFHLSRFRILFVGTNSRFGLLPLNRTTCDSESYILSCRFASGFLLLPYHSIVLDRYLMATANN